MSGMSEELTSLSAMDIGHEEPPPPVTESPSHQTSESKLVLVNMTNAVTPTIGIQSEVARISPSPTPGGEFIGLVAKQEQEEQTENRNGETEEVQPEDTTPNENGISVSSAEVIVEPKQSPHTFDLTGELNLTSTDEEPRVNGHDTTDSIVDAIKSEPEVGNQLVGIEVVAPTPIEEQLVSCDCEVSADVKAAPLLGENLLEDRSGDLPVGDANHGMENDQSNTVEEIVPSSEFVEEEIKHLVDVATSSTASNSTPFPEVNWLSFLSFLLAILLATFVKCIFMDDISLIYVLGALSLASVAIAWKLGI